MSEEEIEEFITELDLNSRDMCVFPNQQTYECCNCYLCRVNYFNQVRKELHERVDYFNQVRKELHEN